MANVRLLRFNAASDPLMQILLPDDAFLDYKNRSISTHLDDILKL